MKFLSIIFAIWILALNFAPVLDAFDSENDTSGCSSTCCAAPSSDDQPTEDNEGDCNDCNPFMSCSTCVGFTIPLFVAFSQPIEQLEEQYSFYNQSCSLQFLNAVWHPPKLG